MRNPYLDAAKAELEAAGIRDYELAHGSEHLQLRWSVTGITRVLWVPRTPSDWRSPRNIATCAPCCASTISSFHRTPTVPHHAFGQLTANGDSRSKRWRDASGR